MGWAYGVAPDGRPIGYSVAATCDEPGCDTSIDRGLSYVCGHMHGGDGIGCGNYFCYDHLVYAKVPSEDRAVQVCRLCAERLDYESGDDDSVD